MNTMLVVAERGSEFERQKTKNVDDIINWFVEGDVGVLDQIAPPIGWSKKRIFGHFPRLAERRTQETVTMSGGE